MSRRGNGLSANAYRLLIDLAPELADTMLTALREAGIAAYATEGELRAGEPAGSGTGSRLERLYVDEAMQSAAEDILHTHLARLQEQRMAAGPGHASGDESADGTGEPDSSGGPPGEGEPGPGGGGTTGGPDGGSGGGPSGGTGTGSGPATAERDEDAIWAEIVAGFDTGPGDGAAPWPDQENVEPGEDDVADHEGRLPSARVIRHAGMDIEQPPDASADDDEDHYVPPPPPPLPTGDPVTRGAWVALVGGPLYLLLTVILGWDVPGWAAFLAVAAFIGGFVALVLRMGDEPRDPDDGAVI